MIIQALVTLKQKVRKYNKEFETEIQSFRENPVNSEDERAEIGRYVHSGTSLIWTALGWKKCPD